MAKDKYHEAVRKALVKDGWTITHDPYTISAGSKEVYIDLGAERIIAAEKGIEKIAVEIKTFRSASDIYDFERAIGQYVLYHSALRRREPERVLYLAVHRMSSAARLPSRLHVMHWMTTPLLLSALIRLRRN